MTGPDHEPVAHDLGVGRVFLFRGEQNPGGSHCVKGFLVQGQCPQSYPEPVSP